MSRLIAPPRLSIKARKLARSLLPTPQPWQRLARGVYGHAAACAHRDLPKLIVQIIRFTRCGVYRVGDGWVVEPRQWNLYQRTLGLPEQQGQTVRAPLSAAFGSRPLWPTTGAVGWETR